MPAKAPTDKDAPLQRWKVITTGVLMCVIVAADLALAALMGSVASGADDPLFIVQGLSCALGAALTAGVAGALFARSARAAKALRRALGLRLVAVALAAVSVTIVWGSDTAEFLIPLTIAGAACEFWCSVSAGSIVRRSGPQDRTISPSFVN